MNFTHGLSRKAQVLLVCTRANVASVAAMHRIRCSLFAAHHVLARCFAAEIPVLADLAEMDQGQPQPLEHQVVEVEDEEQPAVAADPRHRAIEDEIIAAETAFADPAEMDQGLQPQPHPIEMIAAETSVIAEIDQGLGDGPWRLASTSVLFSFFGTTSPDRRADAISGCDP